MLADVVDVDSARSGGQRAGAYFAFLGFSEKVAIAFGTGVSLNIVGLLGFDPSGGVAGSTEAGVMALRLVYCLGPIFFYGLAMKLIWSYPLTPERHTNGCRNVWPGAMRAWPLRIIRWVDGWLRDSCSHIKWHVR